jgi:hypothetical protein
MLITLLYNSYAFECGPSFIVTVAKPLNVVKLSALFLKVIPVIVKLDILCLCIAVPLSNTIINEVSNIGAVMFPPPRDPLGGPKLLGQCLFSPGYV